jgi:membrane peptidoglycan carboxypeptidase
MWTGFGSSINTFFVPLEQMVGVRKVVDVAKRLGIEFRTDIDIENATHPDNWGAFTLGVSATTPLQLANAYATLAADGTFCEPIPVLEIRDINGNKSDAANPRCKNVVNPEVARAAVDMARCPVGDQSASGNCSGSTAGGVKGVLKRPVAGKTGTTDSEKSATFVAMTKQLAVAGFLTDTDWPETTKNMKHPPINYAVAYTLRDGVANKPVVQFTAPTRAMAFGNLVPIPNVKCQPVEAAKGAIKAKGFTVGVSSEQVASECPPGTVARTSPASSTVKGGAVTIYVSKGPGNAAPGGPPTGPGRKRCPVPFNC